MVKTKALELGKKKKKVAKILTQPVEFQFPFPQNNATSGIHYEDQIKHLSSLKCLANSIYLITIFI